MDAHRHAGQPRRHHRLERRQVAGVDDGRAMLPEQPVEPRIKPHRMPGRLVQRDEFDAGGADAFAEIGDFGQRNDGVPECMGGHVVDQVDDAVLEAADVEPIHHVRTSGRASRASLLRLFCVREHRGHRRPRVVRERLQRGRRSIAVIGAHDDERRIIAAAGELGPRDRRLGPGVVRRQASTDPVPLPGKQHTVGAAVARTRSCASCHRRRHCRAPRRASSKRGPSCGRARCSSSRACARNPARGNKRRIRRPRHRPCAKRHAAPLTDSRRAGSTRPQVRPRWSSREPRACQAIPPCARRPLSAARRASGHSAITASTAANIGKALAIAPRFDVSLCTDA